MATHNWHTYTRSSYANFRCMHDLACFGNHLPFFLGITVFTHDIDTRNAVERQRMSKFLCLWFFSRKHLTGLFTQFMHSR